jgi:hypothetical protein
MNCFETRNDFVAFWQRTLASERRAELLAHLRRCASCDHAFRVFALSAPVLYSATEPPLSSNSYRAVAADSERSPHSGSASRPVSRTISRVAAVFSMAAAEALALYFAAPPRMTFEDAIGSDNPKGELASYPATDSFFGKALLAEDASGQDLSDD